MSGNDAFADLARYYDPIMNHVNYDRWLMITTGLAECAPQNFLHLDAGCGTGTLLNLLRRGGWHSFGIDASPAMLQAGCSDRGPLPVAIADLRHLPFHRQFSLITCLFDTLNFLLEETQIKQAFAELARALADGGILYCDVVTERMILEYFADNAWHEDNGGFRTHWSTSYAAENGCAETKITVNSRKAAMIRERIYPKSFIEECIVEAGLTLLGDFDADSWKRPTKKTTRLDYVVAKNPDAALLRSFARVCKEIRSTVHNS